MSTSAMRGVTLVELIVFMVIVGVALAGIFAAFNTMTAASADPQVRKQALAIAESLMEEVALMPFTWCDPDNPLAATATSTAGCSPGAAENAAVEPPDQPSTKETGEARDSTTTPFDNVNDYHAFSMSPIKDITGANITGLESYTAAIRVTQAGLTPAAPFAGEAIAASEALRISVTVTAPSGVTITLEGYRTRYAPTTLP